MPASGSDREFGRKPVFHARVVHREDGMPIQLEDRYVVVDFAADFLEQDFTVLTPSAYLSSISPLQDAEPGTCLVILQDLTRVRQLETVRRDFISNISHELRTPLAGLKALVDTLRGGAIKDRPADMVIAMHLCRGNFQSTWAAEGAYDAAADAVVLHPSAAGLDLA